MPHVKISVPDQFNFHRFGTYSFEEGLASFDWGLANCEVTIDFTGCHRANYQTLSLLVLYAWRLRKQGCTVQFDLEGASYESGASAMWRNLGAHQLWAVLQNPNQNFRSRNKKPLHAIRHQVDFNNTLHSAVTFTRGFDVEYEKTLRYVISELLYNVLEHGREYQNLGGDNYVRVPAIMQLSWYRKRNELQFIIADTGIGIKHHLEQSYPGFEDDASAVRYAIRPHVSGTFSHSNPYEQKNNAGVGLYLSSNIVRRLSADMYLVSGSGLVHISPKDITSRPMSSAWPGTLALVRIGLRSEPGFQLQEMMAEFREDARVELDSASKIAASEEHYISVFNYFGTWAEDKGAAIKYRDAKLLDVLDEGQVIKLDFRGVESAPHSFLSALLATPIKRLGIRAYKQIRIVNAVTEIRETIDYILDENT
ncbi:MAG: ATP-binding protein [Trueperaceae bacterium]